MCLNGDHAAGLACGPRKHQCILAVTSAYVDDNVALLGTVVLQPELVRTGKILVGLHLPPTEFAGNVVKSHAVRKKVRSCPMNPEPFAVPDLYVVAGDSSCISRSHLAQRESAPEPIQQP